ncbi:CSC1 1 [Solea senegalensis]|uniref:CSC1 1 n=1 Tax=Solea senegalensis TaxID=28829 RepID=A0AAV6RQK8_SOLSE|nr:CSC1 1 [Solea senegalensis]
MGAAKDLAIKGCLLCTKEDKLSAMAGVWYILTDTDAPSENFSSCFSTTHSTVLSGVPFGGVPVVFLLYLGVFLVIGLIFSVLKKVSDHWRIAHFADEAGREVFTEVTPQPAEYIPPVEDARERGYISWLAYFLTFTEEEIREKCGPDGINYLSFQLHLIIALVIMTFFALTIILPVNINGDLLGDSPLIFGRTTVANIPRRNKVIWLHTMVPVLHLFLIIFLLQSHTSKITESDIIKNTLMMSSVPKTATKEDIEAHFNEAYPSCHVSAVSLGHNVTKLMQLHIERVRLVKHLHYYRHLQKTTGIREMINPYLLGRVLVCLEHQKVDAINHYRIKHFEVLEKIQKEAEKVPQNPLGIAFVTLKNETMANYILKNFNALRLDSIFVGRQPERSSQSRKLKVNSWSVSIAPHPQDLNWANLSVQGLSWFVRNVVLNFFLFFLLTFLTTPSIILNTIDKLDVTKTIEELQSPIVSEFFPTLLMCIFSSGLPTLVHYSTRYEGHWSRSSEQVFMLRKLYFFLIFMVLILPSLGLTSLSVFLRWTLDTKFFSQAKLRFECVFLPDQGAFFVNYVIAEALVGSGMEWLRLPQLVLYNIKMALADSDAGRKYVKENQAYEFPYGPAYGWNLCVFTVVMAYGVICPIIMPFGLLYMLIRHLVDKFNLCYAYRQGRLDCQVHQAAVNQALAAPIISIIWLYYLSVLRTSLKAPTSLFILVILVFTVFICIGHTCFGYFKYLSPHKYKVVDLGQDKAEEAPEAFVPKELDPNSYMDEEENMVDIYDLFAL